MSTSERKDRPEPAGKDTGDTRDAAGRSGAGDGAGDKPRPEPVERSHVTEHVVTVGGRAIPYRATAGTLVVRDDDGKPRASVFHVAYHEIGADPAARPITFVFNGGPGSSALWLQLGAFGPRRLDVPDAVCAPPPPYRLVDNPHTLLDVTDLVFVDPVRTGYSRPEGEAKDDDFLGLDKDLESMAELIRLYVTRHGRWASPKFIAGESYGSMRTAGLLGALHEHGMACNGGILISVVLDLTTLVFETHRDLPPVLYLPTYAATAWYHDALPSSEAGKPPLDRFLDDARELATTDYALALMKGARLGAGAADALAARLSRLTGLSVEFLQRARLRVSPSRFGKELLRHRGQVVGRLDSRYVGRDLDDAGAEVEGDPAMAAILPVFTGGMQHYLRAELGFEDDRRYHALNFDANKKWKWHGDERLSGPHTVEPLRRAMTQNPYLQLFVANGYYDLATPFLAVEHSLDHAGLSRADLDRVHMRYYEAGHMMYLHPPSHARMTADLRAFYAAALRR